MKRDKRRCTLRLYRWIRSSNCSSRAARPSMRRTVKDARRSIWLPAKVARAGPAKPLLRDRALSRSCASLAPSKLLPKVECVAENLVPIRHVDLRKVLEECDHFVSVSAAGENDAQLFVPNERRTIRHLLRRGNCGGIPQVLRRTST